MKETGPEPAILDWYSHMVMIDDAREVWGHAPLGQFKIRCSEIASEAVLAKIWLESPTCI